MKKKSCEHIKACQVCGEKSITSVFFLGNIPPVNTMPHIGKEAEAETCYPLELFACHNCKLAQIGLEVDPSILFPPEYPYLSGTTRILRDNFENLCVESIEKLDLNHDAFVVDIGSNDGTLLKPWVDRNFKVLGVEPSKASVVAEKNGVPTKMAFFSKETASVIRDEFGPADIVTAANCFAHIKNVHGVIEGIKILLSEKGVFISENHYLGDLIETVQYDTIYHEHLRYYSLTSLSFLFAMHELEIFDVKRIPTHGGSIRVSTCRMGAREIEPSVEKLLREEAEKGVADLSALDRFRDRVVQSKLDLYTLLAPIKASGKQLVAISAPSRASTLINYTGLDHLTINAVMEIKGSHKIGKYMPGRRIPVVDEEVLFREQPEYALLLSWHIGEELAALLRRKGFRGKFIMPLPKPCILDI